MKEALYILLPCCMTMILVPKLIRKVFIHHVHQLEKSMKKCGNTYQTVGYPAWLSNIFLFSIFFFSALIFFSIVDKNRAWFVYIIFGLLVSISSLLYYYCKWWKVTITDNQKIIFRMPFHKTRSFSMDELEGYLRHDGEGIIYDHNWHPICTETMFVTPPILYNYFLEHKKIIHQRP